MFLLRKLISVITPDSCISCGDEGSLLCEACSYSEIPRVASACYACGAITNNFATCNKCRRRTPLVKVWVVTRYDTIAKELISELKFNSSREAIEPIASLCINTVPILEIDIVTHLPTSSTHIRQRGFDQSKFIAKRLASRRYRYAPLLRRIKKIHQTGSNKKQRREQIKGAFLAINKYLIANSRILLVDDVATTGASLEEAARTLKKAGAKEVSAIVFART